MGSPFLVISRRTLRTIPPMRTACLSAMEISREACRAGRTIRPPDPSCNPYYTFSALLMAGLDGIKNKIDPGEAMDKDLISKAQAGDAAAFEQLIRAHHRRLFAMAYGVLRDRELAEDATQQAFVAIGDPIAGSASTPTIVHKYKVSVCGKNNRHQPQHAPRKFSKGKTLPLCSLLYAVFLNPFSFILAP